MTRRLRVLQVGKFYPPYLGGMESHLELLCQSTRAEVDVQVLVSNTGPRTVREVVDGVPVTRIGTWARVASTSFSPGIAAEIRRARADVVHFHYPNPAAALSYLAARAGGRLVVTYHSDIIRQRVLRTLLAPLHGALLARADAIIATSQRYADSSPVLRAHADRVHVIPFGIATEAMRRVDPAEVARVRAEHGPRIVLAVGRLVGYKGLEVLIRAMREVDARLLVAGAGPLGDALAFQARRDGVEERVRLLGTVPDLRPLYHAADVFTLPSVARNEAFGIVQLEAMACGVPVVNTMLDSGVPFVSPHGVTGLTVPVGDPGALAAALNTLLRDPALRRRMGEAGRLRVETELCARRMATDTVALYHQITGR
jgi:rhamnosyl/mannosyltransferase